MNLISLRFSFHKSWNHFFFSPPPPSSFPLSSPFLLLPSFLLSPSFSPLFPSSLFLFHFSPSSFFLFFFSPFLFSSLPSSSPFLRFFFNLFKSRLHFFFFFSFPLHDGFFFVHLLLSNHKSKLFLFHKLISFRLLRGIKLFFKGRFKNSSRSFHQSFLFGHLPNSPSSSLPSKLFFSSFSPTLLHGSSSFHLFLLF